MSLENGQALLQQLLHIHDNVYFSTKAEKAEKMADLIRSVEAALEGLESEKSLRAELVLIRGRALNCEAEYNPKCEELLSKAVKLMPTNPVCWNALGSCLWKKGEIESARTCFLESLSQSPTREALTELSILVRQLSTSPEVYDSSVQYAKQSIQLDISNHHSWYVLGNSLSSRYFSLSHSYDDLKKALAAYNRSEALGGSSNPDLYFNRGGIHRYLQNFSLAIADFETSLRIDPGLTAQSTGAVQELRANQTALQRVVTRNLSAKVIQQVTPNLTAFPASATFGTLVVGPNVGKTLVVNILSSASSEGLAPYNLVCVDSSGTVGIASFYSIDFASLPRPGAVVQASDPVAGTLELAGMEVTCVLKCFENEKLRFNGESVVGGSASSQIKSETFDV